VRWLWQHSAGSSGDPSNLLPSLHALLYTFPPTVTTQHCCTPAHPATALRPLPLTPAPCAPLPRWRSLPSCTASWAPCWHASTVRCRAGTGRPPLCCDAPFPGICSSWAAPTVGCSPTCCRCRAWTCECIEWPALVDCAWAALHCCCSCCLVGVACSGLALKALRTC